MKQYKAYKDSGIDWIGEIPKHWTRKKLSYIAQVFRGVGYQYITLIEGNSSPQEKVIRIGDFSNFNPILCKYVSQFENYRIKEGNILIGGTGHHFGKLLYAGKELDNFVHSYNIIRLVITKNISKYIAYWLSSSLIREQMDISVLGSGQPFIDTQGLKHLVCLTPPLNEQKQIVQYLDHKTQKIDELIHIKEQKIKLLEEKRTALINETVTKGLDKNVALKDSGVEWIGNIPEHWDKVRIKHTTYVKARIGWKGLRSDEFKELSDSYLITGTDFNNGFIDWTNCYQIEQERYDEDPFIQLQEGDLLITKDGTIGKIALVKELPKQATLNSGIFVTRPLLNQYINTFMYWILNSKIFTNFINYHKTGSTILHLYQNVFVEFMYPLPSLEEQKQIVQYLDHHTKAIDNLIAIEQQKIDGLKEYRQALIAEVVTGKRCVVEEAAIIE